MNSKIIIFCILILGIKINAQNNDSLTVDKYLSEIKEVGIKNPIKTHFLIDEIESYSRSNNYFSGIILAINERAYLYYEQDKLDIANSELDKIKNQKNFFILKENAKLFRVFKDTTSFLSLKEQAKFHEIKGIIFNKKEKLDSALYHLNKSLKINYKTNDVKGIMSGTTNIGISLYTAGLFSESLQHFKNAYQLCIKNDYAEHLPSAINNYASLLVVTNKINEAENLFNSALEAKAINQNPTAKYTLLSNWAFFNAHIEKIDKSKLIYKQAILYGKNNKLPTDPTLQIGLADIYFKSNDVLLAIKTYKKVLKIESLEYTNKKMVFEKLAKSYTNLRLVDSVNLYWLKLNKLINKKEKKDTRDAIASAQNNLENYKKDFAIKILEKDKNILNKKNTIKKIIIISVLILTLLILILAYLYIKQQKLKQQQLKKEIKQKKEHLIAITLRINQKNELLKNLDAKVAQASFNTINNNSLKIEKEIKLAIKNAAINDKDWELFEVFFKDIFQGFYKNLKTKSPGLTDNDLRICSLVKLRFSIKEISNLLFLSIDTIKSTRHRIRKKLALNHEQNLTDFLNDFC